MLRTLFVGIVVFIAVAVIAFLIAQSGPRVVHGHHRGMALGGVIVGMLAGTVAGVVAMIIDRVRQHEARARILQRLETGDVDEKISLR